MLYARLPVARPGRALGSAGLSEESGGGGGVHEHGRFFVFARSLASLVRVTRTCACAPCSTRSAFRAYELIEASDRGFAVDGDLRLAGASAMNTCGSTGVSEELQDVLRAIPERVPHGPSHGVAFPFCRNDASAVAVDEATDEALHMKCDESALPVGEGDTALVLRPLPMLRDEARPVLRVAVDLN